MIPMKQMQIKSNSKVLIVSQHFPPEKSANAFRTYEMAEHLNKLGSQITIISPYPTFPYTVFEKVWRVRSYDEINNINLLNIWNWQPNSRDPGFLSRILYYIIFPLHALIWVLKCKKQFDIIITSNPPIFTSIPGLFSKVFLKKKWIIDLRDLWLDASISLGFMKENSVLDKISRIYEKICYLKADIILVATKKTGKSIYDKYKLNKKMLLVTNGVDIEKFKLNKKIKKKNQIIFIGNVGHVMELENCILAIPDIRKVHDIKLIIVGDGDKREKLEKLVKSKNLDDFVIFKGLVQREQIPPIISESLVGISPTKELSTLEYVIPVKVLEYMACGIPFLACGCGEIIDLQKKSNAGIVVENNPDNIAKGIINLLNDPEKLNSMGKMGKEHINQNYNRADIFMKLNDSINDMN